MTSELSILAARVADFIAICAGELSSEHRENPDFRAHADAEFNGFALMLFTLQFERNPAYRKLCESRQMTPRLATHWAQIPAVPTRAFKELEISCLSPDERTQVFQSSGTTGQKPSRHFHNAQSLALYETSLLAWFRFCLGREMPLAMLTPPPSQAPHSSLVHMFETIRRDFRAPEKSFLGVPAADASWTLDFRSTTETLNDFCRQGQPVAVLGTAFSLVHLVDYLAANNLRFQLPPGSRVMETGGYKNRSRALPKEELHARIAERVGVSLQNIICEYGMSELGSQAYDAPASGAGRFHFPPWARAQIISPETGREVRDGESGLLRIFDLANAFSAMAVQTEDLAVRRGDGFELLGRAAAAEPRGCSLMTA